MCNEYSGYSNYPTWAVKLWMDNDEALSDTANEIASEHRDSAYAVGKAIQEYLEEWQDIPENGMEADIWQWAWGQVDWREIGELLIENLEPEDDDWDDDENEDGDDDDE